MIKYAIGLLMLLAPGPVSLAQSPARVTLFFTGYVQGNYQPCD